MSATLLNLQMRLIQQSSTVRKVAVFAAALALILHCSAQTVGGQQGEAERSVAALEQQWIDAYKNRDLSLVSRLLSDEVIVTVESGQVFSKSGYIAHSMDPETHVEVAELSNLGIRIKGDIAIVTGSYHEKGSYRGDRYEMRDRYTDVWMLQRGKWVIVAAHFGVPVDPANRILCRN